jgi:ribosome-associated toxin RatA of RatAB toxin-antitoxin module
MPASASTIESFVEPDEFREVVLDFESYPEFLPEVTDIEVLERGDEEAVVRFEVDVSFGGFNVKTDYTLRYTIGATKISWTLESSRDLSKNEGYWELEETDDGETLAHYQAVVATNLPIPEEIQLLFAEQTFPKLMERFRDRVEDL